MATWSAQESGGRNVLCLSPAINAGSSSVIEGHKVTHPHVAQILVPYLRLPLRSIRATRGDTSLQEVLLRQRDRAT